MIEQQYTTSTIEDYTYTINTPHKIQGEWQKRIWLLVHQDLIQYFSEDMILDNLQQFRSQLSSFDLRSLQDDLKMSLKDIGGGEPLKNYIISDKIQWQNGNHVFSMGGRIISTQNMSIYTNQEDEYTCKVKFLRVITRIK